MGQHQLLVILLCIIIASIGIAVGMTQFNAQSTESNKDGVTTGIIAIATDAYQYKIRPSSLGGGSHSYSGYSLPIKFRFDEHGSYVLASSGTSTCVITGTSKINSTWTATCTVDDSGRNTLAYSGW